MLTYLTMFTPSFSRLAARDGAAGRAPAIAAATWAASLAWLPMAAHAAPSLQVSPDELSMPGVTLGDTVSTGLTISNRGDQPLIVSAIDLPPPLTVVVGLPLQLAPDSSTKVEVQFAAVDTALTDL